MIEPYILKQRQALPLEAKVTLTKQRIREWYEYWQGMVYVAFSGGKDSTVLLHLVRSLYPEVPAVFCNTGLEYPEIISFVRQTENVTWLKPKKTFRKVIEEFGYPIISKEISMKIRQIRNCPIGSKTYILRTTGIDSKGKMTKMGKLPNKWNFLITAPFKISEYCCSVFKKNPFGIYNRHTKRKPIIGMMAEDSRNRKIRYLKRGCNAFEGKQQSNPMGFWTRKDIWEYIRARKLNYSVIYDLGYENTGCMFCTFGVNKEGIPNRFQLMKNTHPKLYKYCMEKLNLDYILTYCNIPH